MAHSETGSLPPKSLSPDAYLAYLQDDARLRSIRRHADIHGGEVLYTIDDGILVFREAERDPLAESMSAAGFSRDEIDDLLFTPQRALADGITWERDALRIFRAHILEVADAAVRAARNHFVELGPVSNMAVGMADIAQLNAGAGFVPAGGAYILLNYGLAMLPMWFTILRKLPRPWDELPAEGEPLRLAKGTAAIALKIMLGHSMVGLNSIAFELLHSEEARDTFGGDWFFQTNLRLTPELQDMTVPNLPFMCERFIVAHEVCHVLLGHTELLREWESQADSRAADHAERLDLVRNLEFQADEFALQVMLALSPGAMVAQSKIQMLFSSNRVIDALFVMFLLFHSVERFFGESDFEKAHPPARERLRRLLTLFFTRYLGADSDRFMKEVFPRMEHDMDWMQEMVYTFVRAQGSKMLFSPDGLRIWPGVGPSRRR